MNQREPHVTFTKRRIMQLWRQEKKSLQQLLPFAKNPSDFLSLGFQMVGRMKPVLELGYKEDYPDKYPYMLDIIKWMQDNGWEEISIEFITLLDQVDEYINEAHQG